MMCTLPFEPCSSICISGQTGSGKTRWVYQFLTHIRDMYAKDPHTRILYCYGIYQPLFDEMERNVPNFTSKQGLPSAEELDEFTGVFWRFWFWFTTNLTKLIPNPCRLRNNCFCIIGIFCSDLSMFSVILTNMIPFNFLRQG